MTFKDLAKIVSDYEAGKESLNIAQITEVLRILSELVALDDRVSEDGFENHPVYKALLKNGKRRIKK